MILVFVLIYIMTIAYILFRFNKRRISQRKLRALRQLQYENRSFLQSSKSKNFKYIKKRPKL